MASDDTIREEHGMHCMPFSVRIISKILSEILKEKSKCVSYGKCAVLFLSKSLMVNVPSRF